MYKLLVIMSLLSAISHVSGGAGSSNRETRETSLSIKLMYQRHDRTTAAPPRFHVRADYSVQAHI